MAYLDVSFLRRGQLYGHDEGTRTDLKPAPLSTAKSATGAVLYSMSGVGPGNRVPCSRVKLLLDGRAGQEQEVQVERGRREVEKERSTERERVEILGHLRTSMEA